MRLLTLIILLPLFSFSQDSLSVKLWIAFEDKGSYTVSDFTPSELLSLELLSVEQNKISLCTIRIYPYTDYLLILQDLIYNPQQK